MLTRADCAALDARDPLAHLRDLFVIPDRLLYLDGNSLGAQPAAIASAATRVLDEWRELLIGGWDDAGWWDLPVALGDRIGRLLGAGPGQVVVCDTTTTNLYKALHAAMSLRPDGEAVVVEESSFPTDRYVVEAVAAAAGLELRIVARGERVADHLDDRVAVTVINHVDFRTAELLDLEAVTAAIHESGGLALWDLSHSAGVIPMSLDGAGVDFAVGCTYKYLNGGPGSPAYLYAAARHHDVVQPIPGWLGHAAPFAMTDQYHPAPGIRRFLTGTQPIVSMRMVDAALDAFDGVELGSIRAKSVHLTDLFIRLVDERCRGLGVEVVSPRQGERRGSQVSLACPEAVAVYDRLVAAGLRGDHRTPDILRFGFAPMYVSYSDVWDGVEVLRSVLS